MRCDLVREPYISTGRSNVLASACESIRQKRLSSTLTEAEQAASKRITLNPRPKRLPQSIQRLYLPVTIDSVSGLEMPAGMPELTQLRARLAAPGCRVVTYERAGLSD